MNKEFFFVKNTNNELLHSLEIIRYPIRIQIVMVLGMYEELSLNEISLKINGNKSTVYRHLHKLVNLNQIESNNKKYRLKHRNLSEIKPLDLNLSNDISPEEKKNTIKTIIGGLSSMFSYFQMALDIFNSFTYKLKNLKISCAQILNPNPIIEKFIIDNRIIFQSKLLTESQFELYKKNNKEFESELFTLFKKDEQSSGKQSEIKPFYIFSSGFPLLEIFESLNMVKDNSKNREFYGRISLNNIMGDSTSLKNINFSLIVLFSCYSELCINDVCKFIQKSKSTIRRNIQEMLKQGYLKLSRKIEVRSNVYKKFYAINKPLLDFSFNPKLFNNNNIKWSNYFNSRIKMTNYCFSIIKEFMIDQRLNSRDQNPFIQMVVENKIKMREYPLSKDLYDAYYKLFIKYQNRLELLLQKNTISKNIKSKLNQNCMKFLVINFGLPLKDSFEI